MSSAAELIANDPQLQTDAFKAAHEKYSKIASAEVISATQSALKAKGYASVFVAQNGAEALEAIKSLIPDGSSVHNTSSISLNQIGFVDVLKTGNGGKWDNVHGKALEETAGAPSKLVPALRLVAATANYSVSTVDAVTETGDIVVADGSGTRIVPYVAGANVIVVVGANKFVKDVESARDRVLSYTYHLESARVRKAYGWPSSIVSNLITLTPAANPDRIHVIIVNEALGF